jgi:hypothetical protein
MPNYAVQDRATGENVYAYTADQPEHVGLYPFEQFNHIPQKVVIEPVVREISGVSFLRRFSQEQRIAIRDLAKTNAVVDDFMRLLDATIAQGGMVSLDDDDTVAGVYYLSMELPDKGIVPMEILA